MHSYPYSILYILSFVKHYLESGVSVLQIQHNSMRHTPLLTTGEVCSILLKRLGINVVKEGE